MTTTSCPDWAQDCHDCGQSIPGGTWRQYVDETSLRVRHINGCPPGRHSTGIHVVNLGAVVDRRGDFPGRHRHRLPDHQPGVRPPVSQVRVFEADPNQPHRQCFIAVHVGGYRYRPIVPRPT